jgi:hypothetical protein
VTANPDGPIPAASCSMTFYKASVPATHLSREQKCFPTLHQYVPAPPSPSQHTPHDPHLSCC